MAWKGCKAVFALFNFLWKIIVASIAINHLRNIRLDFKDILLSIPDPEIRVVNHPDYTGPVNIICAPSVLANYTNTTCDEVFGEFAAVTGRQKYFSWLYLDPDQPITSTTIHDIKKGRSSLYYLLAISTFLDIFSTFSIKLIRSLSGVEEEVLPAGLKSLSSAMTKANTTTTHMLLCNFFSVSNYSEGLYLLQYIPVYAYWACYITLVVGIDILSCCLYFAIESQVGVPTNITSFLFSLQRLHHDGCLLIVEVLCILFVLVIFGLWGFSSWGFVTYVWNFNETFQAIDVGDVISILKPEYLGTLDSLKVLAKLFGVGGIFEVVEDVVHFVSVCFD